MTDPSLALHVLTLYAIFSGGRTPAEYAVWIRNSDSWGGAIELAILCQYYMIQIAVIDIKNTRVEKFGEDYGERILLIYDGIHYDPLQDSSSSHRTKFSSHDDTILAQALSLAESEKSQRQYTDTRNFSLKCITCGKGLVGQKEAMKHAEETSHTNFSEF